MRTFSGSLARSSDFTLGLCVGMCEKYVHLRFIFIFILFILIISFLFMITPLSRLVNMMSPLLRVLVLLQG